MINGLLFKQMLESGANNLTNKFPEIDALNVFPVPDGDTGRYAHTLYMNAVDMELVLFEGLGPFCFVLAKFALASTFSLLLNCWLRLTRPWYLLKSELMMTPCWLL